MKLVFMWIDKYRNIKNEYLLDNLNLNFHHKYRFEFDNKNKLSFKILKNNDYINSYYLKNQYYNLVVGKNGSGKSSILELLYNGVSIVNDFSNYTKVKDNLIKYKMKINRKFFVIFYDEDKEKFLFWGATINTRNTSNSISISEIKEKNIIEVPTELEDFPTQFEKPYFNSNIFNLAIIGINSDFGNIMDIQEKPIVMNRIKISDNINRKKYADIIIKKNFDVWKKYNLPREESRIYEEIIKYERSDFVKYFLCNINEYKEFKKNSKDIEIPDYFFIDFNFINRNYYEKQFYEFIKKDSNMKKIKTKLLLYYDFIIKNQDKLTLIQKIELFFVFHICEHYLFYSNMPDLFLEFIDYFNNFENISIENIDSFIYKLYDEYLKKAHFIEINGIKSNFVIIEIKFFKNIINFIEKHKSKIVDNRLIFKIDDCNDNELANFIFSYMETFRIGIPFLTFGLYPLLSSGHLQLFKIFNYIVESIKELKEKNNYNKDILLLIDEPDVSLHYEWQRNFIKWLSNFLSQFEELHFHIIITSHSALMLSDIPKENIIRLDRKNNKTISIQLEEQTLAQNIFENLNNDFFINQFIGGYIEEKILNFLNKDNLNAFEKELIKNLGEKILRESLKMKFEVNDD